MRRLRIAVVVIALLSAGSVAGVVGARQLAAPRPAEAPDAAALALQPGLIHPSRGAIRSVVVLDGAVTAGDPIDLKARVDGQISKLESVKGQLADGTVLAYLSTSKGRHRVRMPVDGVVIAADVLKGQEVAIGDRLFVIAPSRFTITVPVDPAMLYRFYGRPLRITVALDRGPAPFDCPFVSIGSPAAPGSNPLESPTYLVCAVPVTTRVFAGVRAQVAITTAASEDALLLPVEAVEGTADQGRVTVVRDGQRVPQPVGLGITDGVRVEILTGLTERDDVLEFPEVPSTEGTTVDP